VKPFIFSPQAVGNDLRASAGTGAAFATSLCFNS
jgi:hypothetical protein